MAGIELISAGDDIKLWDSVNLTLFKQINPHGHNIASIAWAPDNTVLASVSAHSDKIALTYISNPSMSSPEIPIANKAGGLCVDFNSKSRYMLIGKSDNTISLYDRKGQKHRKIYSDHKGPVTTAQFNFNDTYIASGSETGEILLHNVMTGQGFSPLVAPNVQAIRQLQYSFYKKSLLVSASDDGCVNLWDTNTRRMLHSFSQSHRAPASGVAFSPVNDVLLGSVGMDKRIQFYDVAMQKVVSTYTTESPLTSIDLKDGGSTFAVGSTRGKIYIYDMRQGKKPQKILNAHRSSVQALKFRNNTDIGSVGGVVNVKPAPKTSKIPPALLHRQLPPAPVVDPADRTPDSQRTVSLIKNNLDEENTVEDLFSPVREGFMDSREGSGLQSNNASNNTTSSFHVSADGIFSPLADNNSLLKVNRRVAGTESSYVISPLAGNIQTSLTGNRGNSFTLPQQASLSEAVSSAGNVVLLEASPVISNPSVHTHPRVPVSSSLSDAAMFSRFVASPQGRGISASPSLPSIDYMADRGGEAAMGTTNGLLPPKAINFEENPSVVPQGGASMRSPEGALASSYNHAAFPEMGDFPDTGSYSRGVERKSPSGPPINLSTQQVQPFQQQLVRNLIQEAMEDFREQVHRDMLSMHMEMIRQFQLQLGEVRGMLQQYSVNEELLAEVERLREENKRLKKTF